MVPWSEKWGEEDVTRFPGVKFGERWKGGDVGGRYGGRGRGNVGGDMGGEEEEMWGEIWGERKERRGGRYGGERKGEHAGGRKLLEHFQIPFWALPNKN